MPVGSLFSATVKSLDSNETLLHAKARTGRLIPGPMVLFYIVTLGVQSLSELTTRAAVSRLLQQYSSHVGPPHRSMAGRFDSFMRCLITLARYNGAMFQPLLIFSNQYIAYPLLFSFRKHILLALHSNLQLELRASYSEHRYRVPHTILQQAVYYRPLSFNPARSTLTSLDQNGST